MDDLLKGLGAIAVIIGLVLLGKNWNKIFAPKASTPDNSGTSTTSNELTCEVQDSYGNKKTISSTKNTVEFNRLCRQASNQGWHAPVYPYGYSYPYYINRWSYNGYYYPRTWTSWGYYYPYANYYYAY